MKLVDAKKDLGRRTQKGIVMLYIGAVYWLLMGTVSFFDFHIKLLGLFYLIGAGLLFPVGILAANLLNIDFFAKGNPLSDFAGVIGGMQILFAPVFILVFMERPEWLPFFIAVLTGAHFIPFSLLYNSSAYIFLSAGVVLYASVIGFLLPDQIFILLPFGTSLIYLASALFLRREIE